jgi:hypothetical protein
MSEMIIVLQPIVETERANVPAALERSQEPARRPRFGGRRARRAAG